MSIERKRQVFSANRMVGRRRNLRQKSTPAENLLWEKLRRNKLGCKFKRQFSVENFVIDFYCPDFKLAIELDGEIHKRRRVYDEYRTKFLRAYGITEIRFLNTEVLNTINNVVNTIKAKLTSPLRSLS